LEPHIHHIVDKPINKLTSDRPEALKNLQYKIRYNDNSTLSCTGLSHHIALENQNMSVLQVSQSQDVIVYASEAHNSTGLMVVDGATYQF
ncbi:hypothetical protein CWB86_20580, partial [Pseudoalteromonas sp. S1731]